MLPSSLLVSALCFCFYAGNIAASRTATVRNHAQSPNPTALKTETLCVRTHNNTAFVGTQPFAKLLLYSAKDCRRNCIEIYPKCVGVMFYYVHGENENHVCYLFDKNSVDEDVALVPEKPASSKDVIRSLEIVSNCHEFDAFPPPSTGTSQSSDKVNRTKREAGYGRPIETFGQWTGWSHCIPSAVHQIRYQPCEYGRYVQRRRCPNVYDAGSLYIDNAVVIVIPYPPSPYVHPQQYSAEYNRIMAEHLEQVQRSCCYRLDHYYRSLQKEKHPAMQEPPACPQPCYIGTVGIGPGAQPCVPAPGRPCHPPYATVQPCVPTPGHPCPIVPQLCVPTPGHPCPPVPQPSQPCIPTPGHPCPPVLQPSQPCIPTPGHPCPPVPQPCIPIPGHPCPPMLQPSQPCIPTPGHPCPPVPQPSQPCIPTPGHPCPPVPQPSQPCVPTPDHPCPPVPQSSQPCIPTPDHPCPPVLQQSQPCVPTPGNPCLQVWVGPNETYSCYSSIQYDITHPCYAIMRNITTYPPNIPQFPPAIRVPPTWSESYTTPYPYPSYENLPTPASEWSSWSQWSVCSATCGTGTEQRHRSCSGMYGTKCTEGQSIEHRKCAGLMPCETWAQWTEWSHCQASCGKGQRSRSRYCHIGNGRCGPDDREFESCDAGVCPEWSPWDEWSSCSATCGFGKRQRYRICQGSYCAGKSSDEESCMTEPCSQWGGWNEWSYCSVSCGDGTKTRKRICLGKYCSGPSFETESCTEQACPSWTDWEEWSPCSATCGYGSQARYRTCVGGYCSGDGRVDLRVCEADELCSMWMEWQQWSSCSVSCGEGIQSRSRECSSEICPGKSEEERKCSAARECAEWTEWGAWTSCSHTCGLGTKSRHRECQTLDGNYVSSNCIGNAYESVDCVQQPCCQWSEWTSWSDCDRECNGGKMTRTRMCQRPGNGQEDCHCPGNDHDFKQCDHLPPCLPQPTRVVYPPTPEPTGPVYSDYQPPKYPLFPTHNQTYSPAPPLAYPTGVVSPPGKICYPWYYTGYTGPHPCYQAAPFVPGNATLSAAGHGTQPTQDAETGIDHDAQPSQGNLHCQWTEWYAWSQCSDPCSRAVVQRSRTCVGDAGCNCYGRAIEYGECAIRGGLCLRRKRS